jgi:Domain of unknown function (DUF4331)
MLDSAAIDARVDITDQYVFQKPGDPTRAILILNVNPLAPRHAEEFRHDAIYETLVDTDHDATPNIAFRYRFSRKQQGQQFAHVSRVELHRPLEDGHLEGDRQEDVLIDAAPVSFGRDVTITQGKYDIGFFAGMRSDPFFFDLIGFWDGMTFTGSDFFVDKNVYSIALDIPNQLLARTGTVGIWSRTLVPMMLQPDHFTQVDQVGRPAVTTLFALGRDRNLFEATYPGAQPSTVTSSGATFLDLLRSQLQRLGGYSDAQAHTIAQKLLPDVLQFDCSSSDGFWNGRHLDDDVIDAMLALATNGKITTDGVGPHKDYLTKFPYLGDPHP